MDELLKSVLHFCFHLVPIKSRSQKGRAKSIIGELIRRLRYFLWRPIASDLIRRDFFFLVFSDWEAVVILL